MSVIHAVSWTEEPNARDGAANLHRKGGAVLALMTSPEGNRFHTKFSA